MADKEKLVLALLAKAGINQDNFDVQKLDQNTFAKLAALLDNNGIDPYHLLHLYDERVNGPDVEETSWAPKWTHGTLTWEDLVSMIETGEKKASNKLTAEALSKFIKEEVKVVKEARGDRAKQFELGLVAIRDAIKNLEQMIKIEDYEQHGNMMGGELRQVFSVLNQAVQKVEDRLDSNGWTFKNPRNNPNWQEPTLDGFIKGDIVKYLIGNDGKEYVISSIHPEWGKKAIAIVLKDQNPKTNGLKHVSSSEIAKI